MKLTWIQSFSFRYLASDACVAAGKPLVSGAALGTDGQLTVYNHGPDGAPCSHALYSGGRLQCEVLAM